MDTQQLVSSIRSRFNHKQSKLYLEEKYENQLIIVSQGGTWQVTLELLSYLRTAPRSTILLDYYNNPVKVETPQLLADCQTTYDTIMTQWHDEYQELIKQR